MLNIALWRGELRRRPNPVAGALMAERRRQVARIGSSLNQIARWVNTYASAAEAVANLVAIERPDRAPQRPPPRVSLADSAAENY